MKEAHSIGEFPIPKEVNLLDVSSSLVAECGLGSEIDEVVVSELSDLCSRCGVEVNVDDLGDFKREPSLYQRFLDNLHNYGFNACLSNFSIRKINSEVEGNFPFLDKFTRRLSSYVLTARYVSHINGIDETVCSMFAINLAEKDHRFIPRLRVSKYVQLPESMSRPLSRENRRKWKETKESFETRRKVL